MEMFDNDWLITSTIISAGSILWGIYKGCAALPMTCDESRESDKTEREVEDIKKLKKTRDRMNAKNSASPGQPTDKKNSLARSESGDSNEEEQPLANVTTV